MMTTREDYIYNLSQTKVRNYSSSKAASPILPPQSHLIFAIMKSFIAAIALPALVSAHGHVDKVIADGVTYQGWNAALKYQTPIPATVGWQADNLDNGFVTPDRFGTVDIVCHKSAKSNGAFVPVKPGSKITFKWVRLSTHSLSEKPIANKHRTGHMAHLPRRPHPRIHRPCLWRLLLRLPHLPPMDQNPILRLEIRQQPRRLGNRRPRQEQLFLGLNNPEPRAWQLRDPPRNPRPTCCGPNKWSAGIPSVY
jgi:hypothetical protein